MSYTQKMRSWIWTILGALLAMMLWKTAQRIERFTASELGAYSREMNTLIGEIQKAGKSLTEDETSKLRGFIKADKLQEGRAFMDTLRTKYTPSGPPPEERLDILTNLIDDARKRITSIETQSADAKAKGETKMAELNVLSSGTLPPVDLDAKPGM